MNADWLFVWALLEKVADVPAFLCIADVPVFLSVRDWYFSLIARIVKPRKPELVIAHSWRLGPGNRGGLMRPFPELEQSVDEMLSNDLRSHLRCHSSNFVENIGGTRPLEVLLNSERRHAQRAGHIACVRRLPTSMHLGEHTAAAARPEVAAAFGQCRFELGTWPKLFGIRIDRHAKASPGRIRGLKHLQNQHPEYVVRLTFRQVGVTNRGATADYDALNPMHRRASGGNKPRIGSRFTAYASARVTTGDRTALVALLLMRGLYQIAVLHEEKNPVSEKFGASITDGNGVLAFSVVTAAALDFANALILNRFAVAWTPAAIHETPTMPTPQHRPQVNECRSADASNNVCCWAGKLISTLSRMEPAEIFGAFSESSAVTQSPCGMTQYGLSVLPSRAAILRNSRRVTIGCDFDGTLCPITSSPPYVGVPRGLIEILGCVSVNPCLQIIVISGRAVNDLAIRMPIEVMLGGSHSLDLRGRGLEFEHPCARELRPELARLSEELRIVPRKVGCVA